MSTPAGPRAATEKQSYWIDRKLADHAGNPAVAPVAEAVQESVATFGFVTFATAQSALDVLFKLPRWTPATPGGSVPSAPAPTGLHLLDGKVYKVQISQTGNRYAKLLVFAEGEAKGSFEYAGSGPVRKLSEATALTLEQAKQIGLATGVCAVCGLTLTDPKSVEQGIGPVCIKKFARKAA